MSNNPTKSTAKKVVIVLALMTVAFLGAHNFATAQGNNVASNNTTGTALSASGGTSTASTSGLGAPSTSGAASASGGGCGMGCCGGGSTEPVEGAATVAGNVQTIDIDTSTGSFAPNVVKAKAGVPIELNFSQAPGGCLAGVLFADFNISEDLTAGPKTISLPALEPGTYTFTCQMQMVSGQLVVE